MILASGKAGLRIRATVASMDLGQIVRRNVGRHAGRRCRTIVDQ